MEIIKFLNNPDLLDIVKQYNATKNDKQRIAYNLFTISSYNSYLENFHSDIIASLLNPKGLHQQGDAFLQLFIGMLNQHYGADIIEADFKEVIVLRETGRLDIWIRDEKSRQCIIIENKINNAPDMKDQIDRYFMFAEIARKYAVKAVVYLSLDGRKIAPSTIENLGHLIKNIGAFTENSSNLVADWLQPCLQVANNMDSISVIHQYINLIKHLANKTMDENNMERFYQFFSDNDGIGTVNTIIEMYKNIASHRADKFSKLVTDILPFKSKTFYRPDYLIYQNYQDGNNLYQLDVMFRKDGSALLVFWKGKTKEASKIALTEKLKTINALHEFEDKEGRDSYHKNFKIGDAYKTMCEVDNVLAEFVKKFLSDLRTHK